MDPTLDAERPQVSIDEALAGGWFELWYQPKIDLKQKCLAGAEAFARIRHPVHGSLGPGTFVPIADAGSIERLTEYALISTLTNWSAFERAGFHLHLSLNVPVRLLWALPISDIVDRYRPHSERWPGIILEVTAQQAEQGRALLAQAAEGWRSQGVTIAIDDVGADASIDGLDAVPIGEFKLANGFAKDCAIDADRAGICQAAIDLAHRYGAAAVVSGVETQTDLRALMAMGCDFGQGPVIAPHMSHEDFLDMLLQRADRRGAEAPVAGDLAAAAAGAIGRVA